MSLGKTQVPVWNSSHSRCFTAANLLQSFISALILQFMTVINLRCACRGLFETITFSLHDEWITHPWCTHLHSLLGAIVVVRACRLGLAVSPWAGLNVVWGGGTGSVVAPQQKERFPCPHA